MRSSYFIFNSRNAIAVSVENLTAPAPPVILNQRSGHTEDESAAEEPRFGPSHSGPIAPSRCCQMGRSDFRVK
ncbi:hypothetical protein AAFF_G00434910 [Aldrovandia affinis]|uniref:Uncharacterized protein n=1 Tax=Aldrovandia affinis TaxID=143900 RepID=A0AAD7S871_9TELE|nr:hypothetical protein AAFF_G00434910 [Aldrovandia affinis]